jgi:hypothetical protein
MKSRLVPMLLLLSSVALIGCNTQAKWTYPIHSSELFRSSIERSDLVIGVLPFKEERPVRNRSATWLLYLIPLMPFGFVSYERPEAARMFNTISKYEFQLDEDLAKAATRSLEQSGLFKRAYFTFGGETREADYLFEGVAQRIHYDGKVITYGLSVFGPVPWFVGLPAGKSGNDVELTFRLLDHDVNEVWSYSFKGRESVTQGLYYNYGNDVLGFATVMEQAMNAALRDLSQHLDRLKAAGP